MVLWTVDNSANIKLVRVDAYDDGVKTVSNRDASILKSDGSLSGCGLNNYGTVGGTGNVTVASTRNINGI